MAVIEGTSGANRLFGTADADTINGREGNDVLTGEAGADRLHGGSGIDIASYASDTAGVVVDLTAGTAAGGDAEGDVLTSIEYLEGGSGNDSLTGNGLANRLFGGLGADTLIGLSGDDLLAGGAGADRLDGGLGIDSVSYAGTTDIAVSLTTGTGHGGDAAGDVLVDVENLFGGSGADSLVGSGVANHLAGGGGADTLDGMAGDDTLVGGDGSDRLAGGAGADSLHGADGIDMASYAGDTAGVVIDLAAGTAAGGDAEGDVLISIEYVEGGSGDDRLTGDGLANRLVGGLGADTLIGMSGDDRLAGGGGADRLDGGLGIDSAFYDEDATGVAVSLTTGTGHGGEAEGDVLVDVENLFGGSGADSLVGSGLANRLAGGGGADTLGGMAGDDTLFGGDGSDILVGGTGADSLNGGSADDTASYAQDSDGVTVDLTTGIGLGGDAEGDND